MPSKHLRRLFSVMPYVGSSVAFVIALATVTTASAAPLVAKNCRFLFERKSPSQLADRGVLATDAAYDGGFNLIAAIDRHAPANRLSAADKPLQMSGEHNAIRIGEPLAADLLQPRTASQLPTLLDERLAAEPRRVPSASWETAYRSHIAPISLDRIRLKDSELIDMPQALTIASALRTGRSGVFLVGFADGTIKLVGRGIKPVDLSLEQDPIAVLPDQYRRVVPETSEALSDRAVLGVELEYDLSSARSAQYRPTLLVARPNQTIEKYALTPEQWALFFAFQTAVEAQR